MPGTRSGYSGTPLPRKLGINDGARVAVVSAPAGFATTLGKLPTDVQIRPQARGRLDVIVFFVTRRAELARRFPVFARRSNPTAVCGSRGRRRRQGWRPTSAFDAVQSVGLDAGLVDNKVAAIDETWSGLRFVYRLADRP